MTEVVIEKRVVCITFPLWRFEAEQNSSVYSNTQSAVRTDNQKRWNSFSAKSIKSAPCSPMFDVRNVTVKDEKQNYSRNYSAKKQEEYYSLCSNMLEVERHPLERIHALERINGLKGIDINPRSHEPVSSPSMCMGGSIRQAGRPSDQLSTLNGTTLKNLRFGLLPATVSASIEAIKIYGGNLKRKNVTNDIFSQNELGLPTTSKQLSNKYSAKKQLVFIFRRKFCAFRQDLAHEPKNQKPLSIFWAKRFKGTKPHNLASGRDVIHYAVFESDAFAWNVFLPAGEDNSALRGGSPKSRNETPPPSYFDLAKSETTKIPSDQNRPPQTIQNNANPPTALPSINNLPVHCDSCWRNRSALLRLSAHLHQSAATILRNDLGTGQTTIPTMLPPNLYHSPALRQVVLHRNGTCQRFGMKLGRTDGPDQSSSAVHIQWLCLDLNPGHLTCEASGLSLLHQRTLGASEFSRLNRRTCSHLSDVIGVPDSSNDDLITYIAMILPRSPACDAGLQVGDRILTINGSNVDSMTLESAIDLIRTTSRILQLTYEPRPFTSYLLTMIVRKQDGKVGIRLKSQEELQIDVVLPHSPAARVGLRAGQKVVGLNGHNVVYWDQSDAMKWLRAYPDEQDLLITVSEAPMQPEKEEQLDMHKQLTETSHHISENEISNETYVKHNMNLSRSNCSECSSFHDHCAEVVDHRWKPNSGTIQRKSDRILSISTPLKASTVVHTDHNDVKSMNADASDRPHSTECCAVSRLWTPCTPEELRSAGKVQKPVESQQPSSYVFVIGDQLSISLDFSVIRHLPQYNAKHLLTKITHQHAVKMHLTTYRCSLNSVVSTLCKAAGSQLLHNDNTHCEYCAETSPNGCRPSSQGQSTKVPPQGERTSFPSQPLESNECNENAYQNRYSECIPLTNQKEMQNCIPLRLSFTVPSNHQCEGQTLDFGDPSEQHITSTGTQSCSSSLRSKFLITTATSPLCNETERRNYYV
ncbi:syntenin-1 [Clonorchis sinensis]|uniref:Syntenin-1 n=1 Tax=Clonorchis sinensis TaxID=79923 RepID=G7YEC4_CLOSI|nr:syntenin-1 [Clonorchis sinensis]